MCVVSALVIFPRIAKTEFSADEPGWISSGYYYTTLAQKRDLDWDKWFCRECEGFGRLNLHVGEFLFGIPMKIEKDSASPAFFGFYNVDHSYEENFRAGLVPPPAILSQARSVAAFFGVLCCLHDLRGWVLGLQSMGRIDRVWFTTDKLSFPETISPGHDRHFLQFLLAKYLPGTCGYSQGSQQESNPSSRLSYRRAHRAGLLSQNYRDSCLARAFSWV